MQNHTNMKRHRSPTPFIAALLVGLTLLAATQLPGAFAARQPQINIAQLQSDPGSLAGPFTGQVKLDWTVLGVYTDTWPPPRRSRPKRRPCRIWAPLIWRCSWPRAAAR